MEYVRNKSRLSTYLKDARALYYYANKAVRVPALRDAITQIVRLIVPASNLPQPQQAEKNKFEQEGCLIWNQLLDAAAVARIREYFKGKKVHDFRDVSQTPLDLPAGPTEKTQKLKYFASDIANCEELVKLANRPEILALAAEYLGCKPTISTMELWWTKAGTQTGELYQDDMFHRDADDFRFLKLFVYLSDVEAENGAHSFIRGSHRSAKLTERKPITEEEIAKNFAAKDTMILTGPSGMGFLEVTWGLHRSLPIQRGERLLFSITYAMTDLNPTVTKAPVAQNLWGVDPYINRVYLEKAAA